MEFLTPMTYAAIIACLSFAVLIQSLSGFGFGLIVVSCFTLFDLLPLTATTLLVSVLGLTNSAGLALKQKQHVDWTVVKAILVTGLPLMVVGFVLLEYMSQNLTGLLKMILGICIMLSCLLMLVEKRNSHQPASPRAFSVAGAIGGVLGGLFSTFGPPVVYLMYQQNWDIARVRSTLLTVFSITAIFRIVLAFMGTIPSTPVLLTILFAIPVVVMMTALGHKITQLVPAKTIRPLAIGLLFISGASILLQSL